MKPENVKKRIHPCLVTSISKYLESVGLPAIWGAPAAFTLIQAIAGKSFYFRTPRGFVYLPAYRFLIGAPGSGKSMVTDLVDCCLVTAKIDVPIAPSSVTRASLVDELGMGTCIRAWGMDAQEQINTILINSSEYGVFTGPVPGDDLFRTMADLWDCRAYRETRRSKKEQVHIKNPYINMLTGTQPEHFASSFPRPAWRQGYASRCDFYYSEHMADDSEMYMDYDPTLGELTENEKVEFARTVAHDLQCLWADMVDPSGLRKVARQLYMSGEAAARFLHWCKSERIETEFTHPWLIDYNARRRFRLRRDTALFCLARGDTNYVIQLSDVENAIELHAIQDAGLTVLTDKIMTSDNGDILSMVHQWAMRVCAERKGKPIPRSMVTEFVMTKVKIHEVNPIMRHLIEHEILLEISKVPSGVGNALQVVAVPMLKPNPAWVKL